MTAFFLYIANSAFDAAYYTYMTLMNLLIQWNILLYASALLPRRVLQYMRFTAVDQEYNEFSANIKCAYLLTTNGGFCGITKHAHGGLSAIVEMQDISKYVALLFWLRVFSICKLRGSLQKNKYLSLNYSIDSHTHTYTHNMIVNLESLQDERNSIDQSGRIFKFNRYNPSRLSD